MRSAVGVAVCLCFVAAGDLGGRRPSAPGITDANDGAGLYAANCSSCHGPHGRGNRSAGPTRRRRLARPRPVAAGVGARGADFYLRTGYMPLASANRAALAKPSALLVPHNSRSSSATWPRSARALEIPRPDPARGSLSAGLAALHRQLRRLPPDRRRGRLRDRRARPAADPGQRHRDRRSRADRAVRDAELLTDARSRTANSTRSSATSTTRSIPTTRGGLSLGRLGPIPEGMVTWLIAASVLVGTCVILSNGVPHEQHQESVALPRRHVLLAARKAPRAEALGPTRHPSREKRRAENAVLALARRHGLWRSASSSCTRLDRLPDQTQFLGLSIGLAFVFLAAAFGVIGKRLVVDEEAEEDYPPDRAHRGDRGDRAAGRAERRPLTRRKLLVVVRRWSRGCCSARRWSPRSSRSARLSTSLGSSRRRGTAAGDWSEKTADRSRRTRSRKRRSTPPIPRARPRATRSAARRRSASVVGHCGCPRPARAGPPAESSRTRRSARTPPAPSRFTAYRRSRRSNRKPALVCPCHYSTFDPATGGTVLFGPAGRPLPQLPLEVDHEGYLRAGGTFSGPVGPSWWGVRARKPTG